MKKRFKTYSFWVSLSGAIVVFVEAIGRIIGFIPNAELINNIVMSIAGILVVFGVVLMPTEEDLSDNEGAELSEEKEKEEDKKIEDENDTKNIDKK